MNCPECQNSMTYHKPTVENRGHYTCRSCPATRWPDGPDHERKPTAFDRWFKRYKPWLADGLNSLDQLQLNSFAAMLRCSWEASARHSYKVRRKVAKNGR